MQMIEYKMFSLALDNAVAWQNRCVELMELIEMFCLDAEAAKDTKEGT